MKKSIHEVSGKMLNDKEMKNLLGGAPPAGCPKSCKIGTVKGSCGKTISAGCMCSTSDTTSSGCS